MRTYKIFGVVFQTYLQLEGLENSFFETPCDIDFRINLNPNLKFSSLPTQVAMGIWRDKTNIFYEHEAVGRAAIRSDRIVEICFFVPLDHPKVISFILGPIIGGMLHQLGILSLHGSAVVQGNRVFAFLGDSQSGKSTLAAALSKQRWQVFSDDIVAVHSVDNGSVKLLEPPKVQLLNSDSIEALRLETPNQHDPINRNLIQNTKFIDCENVILSGAFVLFERPDSDRSKVRVLSSDLGELHLLRYVHRPYLYDTDDIPAAQEKIKAISNVVKVVELHRKKNYGLLPSVVATVSDVIDKYLCPQTPQN